MHVGIRNLHTGGSVDPIQQGKPWLKADVLNTGLEIKRRPQTGIELKPLADLHVVAGIDGQP